MENQNNETPIVEPQIEKPVDEVETEIKAELDKKVEEEKKPVVSSDTPTVPATAEMKPAEVVDYEKLAKEQREKEQAACLIEVNAILAKYKCKISCTVIIQDGALPKAIYSIG